MLGDIVAAFGELGGAVEIAETEFVFKPADGQVLTRKLTLQDCGVPVLAGPPPMANAPPLLRVFLAR